MGLFLLCIYLIGLYIRPQDWWGPMLGFRFDDVICSIGLLLVLVSRTMQKRSVAAPQTRWIIGFVVIALLSNVVHGNVGAGWEQFIFYLKRFAVFAMFLCLIDKAWQLKLVITVAVLMTTFLAVQAIEQYATGIGAAGQALKKGRADWVGMWDGPNVLSLIMVMAVPFPLHRFLNGRGLVVRLINLAMAVALIWAFYVTDSRAGFLSLLLVLFLTAVLRIKTKGWRILSGILVGIILLGLIGGPFAPGRTKDLTTQEASNSDRIWAWEIGLNLAREHKILGAGKGQFRQHSRILAHSNYVENVAETGFIGLFVYMSILYLCFKSLEMVRRKLIQVRKEPQLEALIRPLQISLAGFCLMTMFVTMELEIMFVWWGLCAALYAIARQSVGRIPVRFELPDVCVVGASMVMILFFVYLVAIVEIV